jgi:biotin-dependent carboxylase-like uncharacterized protein
MDQGVPHGGALWPEGLAVANAAVHNPPSTVAIEAFGALTLRAQKACVLIAVDDRRVALEPGESVQVPPPDRYRTRYVAARGGFAVPEVLGGRGTLLVASLGGLQGRALRRGDVLAVGDAPMATRALPAASHPGDEPIRVLFGPDDGRFPDEARAVLIAQPYTICGASDRVGTVLDGPALPRLDDDSADSTPMVRGAIQVPSSGRPIVLGPDHPTTGGYPVIATVIRADVGSLAARRPGSAVRFCAVEIEQARAAWIAHRAWFASG